MSQAELFGEPGFDLGDVERWCRDRGVAPLIGVDEAGRGPLAGPVCAAAVVLDVDGDTAWFELLDDSKKLSEKARDTAAEEIKARAVAYAIAFEDARSIDEINILQASLRAMRRAVEEVAALAGAPGLVLVDGNQRVPIALPQQTLVKGDGRSHHIAAASILAKTARDALMLRAHEQWPEYAFHSNKGYGSKAHRDAIAAHGPCPLHRLTFGGVREHVARLRTQP